MLSCDRHFADTCPDGGRKLGGEKFDEDGVGELLTTFVPQPSCSQALRTLYNTGDEVLVLDLLRELPSDLEGLSVEI